MSFLQKYIGDTWQFPVTLFTDTARTTPKDMTGYTLAGDFYVGAASTPLTLLVGSGVVAIDLATGQYIYTVLPNQYTGIAAMDPAKTYTKFPTRLRVYDTSPSGVIITRGVINILPVAI